MPTNLTGHALEQYLDLIDTPHLLDDALRLAIGIGCIEGSPVESVEMVTFDDDVLTTPDVVEEPDLDDDRFNYDFDGPNS